MTEFQELNPFHKSPQVAWNNEMRTVLCCWKKFYMTDWNAFLDIFSSIFAQELIECGFTDGRVTNPQRLHTQWFDMKNKGHHIWGDVHLSLHDPEPWLPFLQKIEAIAASQNLVLQRKTENDVDTTGFVYRDRVRTSQAQRTPEDNSHERPANLPLREERREQQPLDKEQCLSTAGGKTCVFCHWELLEKQNMATRGLDWTETPPLLYRWWNAGSQGVNSRDMFVAGLFANPAIGYFAPETIPKEEFERRFEDHIRIKRAPSPLISTFRSARAPIHRSLREREGASVSIIDAAKVKSEVYSAMGFVKEHKVKFWTYNGAGEYLIWGKIDRDAIICTFKITTLLMISEEHPDIKRLLQLELMASEKMIRRRLPKKLAETAVRLDDRAGMTIGKLLSILEVPEEHCRTVSEGIAWSWKIKTRYKPWGGFFEGVELGYKGLDERIMPFLSSPASAIGDPHPDADFSDTSEDYSIDDDGDGDDTDTADEDMASQRSGAGHDEANSATAESDTVNTPTPGPRPNVERSVLLLNQISERQQPETIDLIDTDSEQPDTAREELDLFDEMVYLDAPRAHDSFANERARVRYLLD
ncbi:hypothetical protein BJY04DRAFT_214038 [Aspergillus karnatakaensis]|uniref:uncharacterized protein n=1 Tax=Aspergillus karnatakaensis TaxID=1810916 RepID=UPI003CCDC529